MNHSSEKSWFQRLYWPVAIALAVLLLILWLLGSGPCCGCQAKSPTTVGNGSTAAIGAAGAAAVGAVGAAAVDGAAKAEGSAGVDTDANRNANAGAGAGAGAVSAAIGSGSAGTSGTATADAGMDVSGKTNSNNNVANASMAQAKDSMVMAAAGGADGTSGGASATAAIPSAKVYFPVGRSDVDGKDKAVLAAVLRYLKGHSGARVNLAGFHDPRGNLAQNQALATSRASAVARYLQSQGVAQERMQVLPAAVSDGGGNMQLARRVEASITP